MLTDDGWIAMNIYHFFTFTYRHISVAVSRYRPIPAIYLLIMASQPCQLYLQTKWTQREREREEKRETKLPVSL